MKQMNIKQFIYWLRIHGFRLEQFGTGSKKIRFGLKNINATTKTVRGWCSLIRGIGRTPKDFETLWPYIPRTQKGQHLP